MMDEMEFHDKLVAFMATAEERLKSLDEKMDRIEVTVADLKVPSSGKLTTTAIATTVTAVVVGLVESVKAMWGK